MDALRQAFIDSKGHIYEFRALFHFRFSIFNRMDPKAAEEIDKLCLELKEVESQMKACIPITTFLNKKLRMNDVCGGEYSMPGSSEYERVSLSYFPLPVTPV